MKITIVVNYFYMIISRCGIMNKELHIESFKLKNNSRIETSALNVIIGPNSSGKSQLLKELFNYCNGQEKGMLLEDIVVSYPESIKEIEESQYYPFLSENHSLVTYDKRQINKEQYSTNLEMIYMHEYDEEYDPDETYRRTILNDFGGYFSKLLGTNERLTLVQETQQDGGLSILKELYNASYSVEIEQDLNDYVKEIFQTEIRLDFSYHPSLVFRVGEGITDIPDDPRKSRQHFPRFSRLDEQGDGIKSFVGTMLTFCMDNSAVLFVDEPEVFLHPPQAYKIGELIAKIPNTRQIFITTHSAELLKGILNNRESGDIKIIRMERENESSKMNFLNSVDIQNILFDPRLNTEKILSGFFYKHIVIGESESDALFYAKASKKLKMDNEVYYTNAQNKQTIGTVGGPYIKLGIPTCGIFDFDLLKKWDELHKVLGSFFVTPEDQNEVKKLHNEIINTIPMSEEFDVSGILAELTSMISFMEDIELDREKSIQNYNNSYNKLKSLKSPWKNVKEHGRNGLTQPGKEAFDRLEAICRSYGIFILPTGEMESLLRDYGITVREKKKWLVKALEELTKVNYDENKELWKFMDKLKAYLAHGNIDINTSVSQSN